jgi:hypothetical protein
VAAEKQVPPKKRIRSDDLPRQLKYVTWRRWRRTGNRAKTMTEKSVRAKTEMSSGRRDASTTDAETAAFIEITDVNLRRGSMSNCDQ